MLLFGQGQTPLSELRHHPMGQDPENRVDVSNQVTGLIGEDPTHDEFVNRAEDHIGRQTGD